MKKNLLSREFTPQLFLSMREGYTRKKFLADLMSGVIVAIVALPLTLAFGIATGITPGQALITAVIGGFIISFLGGSRVLIGGPTGSFIVIVYGIVLAHGMTGLLIATIMAGVILLLLGIFRLGKIIKFIPYPIIVGFSSGIAVSILYTQIPNIFGLSFGGETLPGDFWGRMSKYIRYFGTVQWSDFAVCAASVAITVLATRVMRRVPGALMAILLVTAVVYFLKAHTGFAGMETIGDRFDMSSVLPAMGLPSIDMAGIGALLPAAITIAMLGSIEALLCATVSDGAVGGRKHNSNTLLASIGIANIIAPLFGGVTSTGAIARTMTNVNNGGRSPVAGIVCAAVLMLILLFLMPLARYIPLACLAGILVVVAYNMSEWRSFRELMRGQRSDAAVLLVTFSLTVLFDLTVAVQVGLLLAVVLFVRRINQISSISVAIDKLDLSDEDGADCGEQILALPSGVEVYEIDGPFFFGMANKFDESMRGIGRRRTLVRIINLRKVPFIDSTGSQNLMSLCRTSQSEGISIVLSGVKPAVRAALERSPLPALIGERNICHDIKTAVRRAEEVLDSKNATERA